MENGEFESIDITPLSSPPELPDVMKGQEATHDTSANWRGQELVEECANDTKWVFKNI